MSDSRCLHLIFVRDKRFISRAVRFFDRSDWSHVGVIDGDYVIQASGKQRKVVKTPIEEFKSGYCAYETRALPGDIEIVRSHIGKAYDISGVKGFIFPWVQHKVSHIFCSEIAALASDRERVRKYAHLVGVSELNRWSDPICNY